LWVALGVWLLTALGLTLLEPFTRMPPVVVPLAIWAPVLAAMLIWRRSARVRQDLEALDLRLPILFHLVRVAFGVLFLQMAARGSLPASFAAIAGPGDIAAGLLAVPAAMIASGQWRLRRPMLLAWNAFALLDILVVFVTAQRLILFVGEPRMLATLGTFPLGVLPLFVVPLVVLTHVLVFVRILRPTTGALQRDLL